jgi:hypothetical protein
MATSRRKMPARDDYHDPTARLAGAPPARSALTLRLILACFGLVVCVGLAAAFAAVGAWYFAGVMVALAVVAAVDAVVVLRRKRTER